MAQAQPIRVDAKILEAPALSGVISLEVRTWRSLGGRGWSRGHFQEYGGLLLFSILTTGLATLFILTKH